MLCVNGDKEAKYVMKSITAYKIIGAEAPNVVPLLQALRCTGVVLLVGAVKELVVEGPAVLLVGKYERTEAIELKIGTSSK